MTLNQLDFKQFLPLWMRDDITASGLTYAVEKQLKKVINNINYALIYSRIDELDDTLLDELAWQFNIIEYSSILPIDAKRYLVKNCMKLHAIRGTKAAVENVINNVFGDGYVEEWFEYGGQPGYFRVHTSNQGTTDEMVDQFTRSIEQTKNLRSWLEEIIIEIVSVLDVGVAVYNRVVDYIYF